MQTTPRSVVRAAALSALGLTVALAVSAPAQETPAGALPGVAPPPAVVHLTLDDAKQRLLHTNKLLSLASLNADSKAYAVRAAQADYFPKISGNVFYFHFNDDLGKVLTTQGRTLSGPRGRPLLTFPPTTVEAAVLNQDTSFASVVAVQPITDLLLVRQGVKIAQADQHIAQAQVEKAIRELISGVEQLYWGLLAAKRIQAGAREGLAGAEMLAKTQSLEARAALVEAQQGLQQVDRQIADLQEQLNGLLDLPLCTVLDLAEPPLPALPFHCADEVVGLALASNPDVQAAQYTVAKAGAGLAAGRLAYVPSVAVIGGYTNQTAADYIQQNIGYVGVVGSYTFVDWGKRRNVIHERQDLVGMAVLKLHQTEDEVRQKTVKAFREVADSLAALKTAEEMVAVRKEIEKKATTPEAFGNPAALAALLKASKDRALAEVDVVKADLAYRIAYVQLMALVGKQ